VRYKSLGYPEGRGPTALPIKTTSGSSSDVHNHIRPIDASHDEPPLDRPWGCLCTYLLGSMLDKILGNAYQKQEEAEASKTSHMGPGHICTDQKHQTPKYKRTTYSVYRFSVILMKIPTRMPTQKQLACFIYRIMWPSRCKQQQRGNFVRMQQIRVMRGPVRLPLV
jgi:hypothetical protein